MNNASLSYHGSLVQGSAKEKMTGEIQNSSDSNDFVVQRESMIFKTIQQRGDCISKRNNNTNEIVSVSHSVAEYPVDKVSGEFPMLKHTAS